MTNYYAEVKALVDKGIRRIHIPKILGISQSHVDKIRRDLGLQNKKNVESGMKAQKTRDAKAVKYWRE